MYGFVDKNITNDIVAVIDVPSITINANSGRVQSWTMTQNTTLNFDATITEPGESATLIITCDATPRTITYGTGVHGGASYVLTASKKHVLVFIYDGTEYCLASTQVLS